jgi:hypothetical protein
MVLTLKKSICVAVWWLLLLPEIAQAKSTDLQPEQFLAEAFGGGQTGVSMLWLNEEQRQQAERILNHPLGLLRVRYWRQDAATAWILDEIGKTEPITIGVVVRDGAIAQIRVLAFRESRGDEIRHAFFTRQFLGVGLTGDSNELDGTVDGITGATLSVRAMRKVARLALYFHSLVVADAAPADQ